MNTGKHLTKGEEWFYFNWNKLVGKSPSEISAENRLVNATNILTLAALLIMLPVNLIVGLKSVSVLNLILIAVLFSLYYLSRFKKKYRLSIACYGALSYLALIVNYHLNSGINGPTLFIFFLTFHLLITVTPKHFHLLWASLHIAVGLGLVFIENRFPEWAPNTYNTGEERVVDSIFTYVIVLAFIYLLTTYLRNNYLKEKALAAQRLLDIEEQNKKLEALAFEKDKLFSIISHDMRSPLSTIQGYLELITYTQVDDEADANVKEELLNLTKQTSDMLSNMLTWYKSQTHGVHINKVAVELNDIIEKTLEVQSTIAANKSISIHLNVIHPATVLTDVDMIQVVIRNVLSNAIKFTQEGGSIHIDVFRRDGKCTISIKDNGIGISSKKKAQIFKLTAATTYGTRREKGLGMGLALCKEYIELLDGSIDFSSSVGEGTEFIITIPEYIDSNSPYYPSNPSRLN